VRRAPRVSCGGGSRADWSAARSLPTGRKFHLEGPNHGFGPFRHPRVRARPVDRGRRLVSLGGSRPAGQAVGCVVVSTFRPSTALCWVTSLVSNCARGFGLPGRSLLDSRNHGGRGTIPDGVTGREAQMRGKAGALLLMDARKLEHVIDVSA